MSLTQSALRITDRFYDTRDPDTMERQGRLQNCVVLVFIFHMMMMVAFIRLQEYEVAHPRVIRDVDVSFEFTPPPPEPPPKALDMPRGISLSAGGAPGSEAAPKALAPKVDVPAVTAPEIKPVQTPVETRPVPSRKTTVAAPVAVTSTNVIKSPIASVPRESPTPKPPPPVAGPTTPAAGAPAAGGGPDGVAGGTGTGGKGDGGTGTGQGGDGSGTGAGGGTAIATSLPAGLSRAMGNIAPYRKDLLLRLAGNWHPKKQYDPIILLLSIDKEGNLLGAEIFQSSGSKKADKEALAAAQATQYAPLPDWYKGEQLTFKIEMSKVEALNQ